MGGEERGKETADEWEMTVDRERACKEQGKEQGQREGDGGGTMSKTEQTHSKVITHNHQIAEQSLPMQGPYNTPNKHVGAHVRAVLRASNRQVVHNACIDVEQVITCHARFPGHTRGNDHQLGSGESCLQLSIAGEALHLNTIA
jgi:hypothetical protein